MYVKRISQLLSKHSTKKLKEAQSHLLSKNECTKKLKLLQETTRLQPKGEF